MARSFGLDIARATAIAGVLVSHAAAIAAYDYRATLPVWVDWIGVLGVEIFFVLSGFLIGRLLLEIAERRPTVRSWFRFMIRRWMRTLPLYAVCLAAFFVLDPPADLKRHALQFLTMTQNFAWPLHDEWFNVTWSLAVEEWFYLFFSAAFLIGAGLLGRPGQVLVVAAFLVFPLAARMLVPLDVPWDAGIRKVMVLRLDAIAYGVVLALLYVRPPHWLRHWRLWFASGVAINVFVFLGYVDVVHLPPVLQRAFSFSLMGIGIALLFPAAIRVGEARGWAAPAVIAVSETSYGLYLLHILVIECMIVNSRWFSAHRTVLVGVACILVWTLAWTSFHFFERPILKRRPRQFAPQPAPDGKLVPTAG